MSANSCLIDSMPNTSYRLAILAIDGMPMREIVVVAFFTV